MIEADGSGMAVDVVGQEPAVEKVLLRPASVPKDWMERIERARRIWREAQKRSQGKLILAQTTWPIHLERK